MSVEIHRPSSPWIGQVLPTAAQACGASIGNPVDLGLPEAQSAIVIVVDGLGWQNLLQWKGYVPTLRPYLEQNRTWNTCLPSTTAAALTSLTTGKAPAQTNMVGYSVARGESVMTLLQFDPSVDAATWQPEPTFFEQLQTTGLRPVVVSAPRFAGSGLTLAAMRGSEFMGADKLEDRFERARHAVTVPSLVYLYWSEIDHAGHGCGVGSDEWLSELEAFDAALGRFLTQIPPETAVMLVSDHGMVNVAERIDLAEHAPLAAGVRLIAGEGRCVHVHAEPGQGAQVQKRWAEYLGDRAVVLQPSQYAAAFGEGPGLELLGDAVAFMTGQSVIVDSRVQSRASIGQKGVHGSFTAVETEIPLLLLNS